MQDDQTNAPQGGTVGEGECNCNCAACVDGKHDQCTDKSGLCKVTTPSTSEDTPSNQA